MNSLFPSDRARLARLRRLARSEGLIIRKSRNRSPWGSYNDQEGFMIIENARNFAVAGNRYDLGLDGIESWLAA